MKPFKFHYRAKIVETSSWDIYAIIHKKIYDPNFKGTVQVHSEFLYFHVGVSKGKLLHRILKERLYLMMSGMMFPINHKLFESFDKKLQQLMTGGIIDHYREYYHEYSSPKRYDYLYPVKPKVLSLQLLEAGFVVWLVSLLLSVIVFILELIFGYSERFF